MSDEESEASARPPSPQVRQPLARDMNGNPIPIPPSAVAWRVRRGGKRRGRPRNVFNADCQQLEVPLGATLDDLIEAGCSSDRYLLYPVDGAGTLIPGLVAVTEVPDGVGDEDEPSGGFDKGLVAQLLATVKAQSDTLCRAIEATTSGYGPVRAGQPTQVVVEQAAALPEPPAEPVLRPDQIAQVIGMVKSVYDMVKGGGLSNGGAPTGGGP